MNFRFSPPQRRRLRRERSVERGRKEKQVILMFRNDHFI